MEERDDSHVYIPSDWELIHGILEAAVGGPGFENPITRTGHIASLLGRLLVYHVGDGTQRLICLTALERSLTDVRVFADEVEAERQQGLEVEVAS